MIHNINFFVNIIGQNDFYCSSYIFNSLFKCIMVFLNFKLINKNFFILNIWKLLIVAKSNYIFM